MATIHDAVRHGSSLLSGSASTNKNSVILFRAPPLVLFLPAMSGTEAENRHMLAALQPLQKNLPPVSEPHRIPILVRFSAQLHKDHFFGRIHSELLSLVLGDIAQQQARA